MGTFDATPMQKSYVYESMTTEINFNPVNIMTEVQVETDDKNIDLRY